MRNISFSIYALFLLDFGLILHYLGCGALVPCVGFPLCFARESDSLFEVFILLIFGFRSFMSLFLCPFPQW